MLEPTTALTTQPKPLPIAEFSAFGNITHFENAQRMAKALSSSAMVPDTYRGEQNLGSCIIALEMANRIGANVLSVMQNLYIVHGKPAWSSQFLIACLNASGRFSPLRYRMTGDKGNDSLGCIAWATDKAGEKLESPEITIAIAKAEGWFQKNGSKWKTMPELMLRYRTATLFARLYAPELSMGIHCEDEIVDIVEIAPVVTTPAFVPKEKEPKKKAAEKPAEKVVDAVVVAAEEPPKEPAPSAPSEPTFEQLVDGESPALVALREAMTKHGVSDEQLLKFAVQRNLVKDSALGSVLADIRADKVEALTKQILLAGATLKTIKGEAA